jgi:nucleoside-diphosphate-sugar epimerase
MTILVTGGCGYIGSVLVPKLLEKDFDVIVLDIMWFGNFLPQHNNLRVMQGNIQDANTLPLEEVDAIIHLAAVSNDPCVELDPKLSWEIGALGTMRLADAAVRKGVKQFIFASSGSVYGIKEELEVTEDLELLPISEYNKTKMVAERIVLSYKDDMIVQVVRPGTVCGYSPRMRLDLSVNMLTMLALSKGVITVFGGSQTRPNIHIDDMTNLYIYLLERGEQIQGVYNAGFENLSIMEIAQLVTKVVPAEIKFAKSDDPRSYRMNSDKIVHTGFEPVKTVLDGVKEVVEHFENGDIEDSDRNYNIRWMKSHCDISRTGQGR